MLEMFRTGASRPREFNVLWSFPCGRKVPERATVFSGDPIELDVMAKEAVAIRSMLTDRIHTPL